MLRSLPRPKTDRGGSPCLSPPSQTHEFWFSVNSPDARRYGSNVKEPKLVGLADGLA
jgi:hypothetical protein